MNNNSHESPVNHEAVRESRIQAAGTFISAALSEVNRKLSKPSDYIMYGENSSENWQRIHDYHERSKQKNIVAMRQSIWNIRGKAIEDFDAEKRAGLQLTRRVKGLIKGVGLIGVGDFFYASLRGASDFATSVLSPFRNQYSQEEIDRLNIPDPFARTTRPKIPDLTRGARWHEKASRFSDRLSGFEDNHDRAVKSAMKDITAS